MWRSAVGHLTFLGLTQPANSHRDKASINNFGVIMNQKLVCVCVCTEIHTHGRFRTKWNQIMTKIKDKKEVLVETSFKKDCSLM